MDTIMFLIKSFRKYDTVKFTAFMFVVMIVVAGIFIYKVSKGKNMGKLAVIIPISCVLMFMSIYLSIIEISNRFVLGVMDNTAATEAELKFRRTFYESDVEFISESGEKLHTDKNKNFTATVEGKELAITSYIADLSANDEEAKLTDVIDIADAEFRKYDYYNIQYETYEIKVDKDDNVKITIKLSDDNYKKLISDLEQINNNINS